MEKVLWFEDIGEDDLGKVGGKGLNLGLMVAQDFPIHPGYVITSDTYYKFIEDEGIKAMIEDLLEDLDVEDTEGLQDASQKIRKLFDQEEITGNLKDDLMDELQKLRKKDDNFNLAVRSSATAEDLPGASFAGQQDTYLGVDE